MLLVPIGSCEQHGPHLPIATDTAIATELCRLTIADLGRQPGAPEVITTPAISIGASGEHDGFPGTLSIGTTALATVVIELIRSADWAAGVLLVNGHGGNTEAILHALRQSHRDGRDHCAAWSPRLPTDRGDDLHAGWVETSVIMHLAPELVDVEAIEPGATPTLAALREHGVAKLSRNGVLGDPTGANAADGAAIVADWVADLRTSIDRHLQQWSPQ